MKQSTGNRRKRQKKKRDNSLDSLENPNANPQDNQQKDEIKERNISKVCFLQLNCRKKLQSKFSATKAHVYKHKGLLSTREEKKIKYV